jgi:hypothetical protein
MTEPYLTNDQLAARWGLQVPPAIKGQRARGSRPGKYYTIPRISFTMRVRFTSAVSIIPSLGF